MHNDYLSIHKNYLFLRPEPKNVREPILYGGGGGGGVFIYIMFLFRGKDPFSGNKICYWEKPEIQNQNPPILKQLSLYEWRKFG